VGGSSSVAGLRAALGRLWRLFSVTSLGLAAVAAVSLAIAWLTVAPVYRATAAIAPADSGAPTAADHFPAPVLADSIGMLAQRGLRPFESADAMAAALDEQLAVAPAPGGQVVLSYESQSRELAVFIVDALARSYVRAHAGAGARITQAAAADLLPHRDDRVQKAIHWFITFVALAAALALVIAALQMFRQRRTRAAA
jgi:hypothetical protein